MKKECPNCQGENATNGYVELWDGICPECGRKIGRIKITEIGRIKITKITEGD